MGTAFGSEEESDLVQKFQFFRWLRDLVVVCCDSLNITKRDIWAVATAQRN